MQYITNMEPNILLPLLMNKQGMFRSANLQDSPWGVMNIEKNVKLVWRGNCSAFGNQLSAFGCNLEVTMDPVCLSTLNRGDSVLVLDTSTLNIFGWYF